MESTPHSLLRGIALMAAFAAPASAFGASHTPARIPAARSAPVAGAVVVGVVNVNEASARELAQLPGVGPALASRIIERRRRRAFRRAGELLRVHGIGWRTLRRLRPYLRLTGETTLRRERRPAGARSGRARRALAPSAPPRPTRPARRRGGRP